MTALRNIGILAHVDAGKTTLTERFLFYSGVSARMGEVEDGTAVMDWMQQEQARGITITAAATRLAWRGTDINLLDTPGHVDFSAEVQRCLQALDGVVVVVSAVEGVQAQTEAVWRHADRVAVPRLAFVNKLDRPGADSERAVQDIERRLGVRAVPLQVPWYVGGVFVGVVDAVGRRSIRFDGDPEGMRPVFGAVPPELELDVEIARERILEVAGEHDDVVLEHWLAQSAPPQERVVAALRKATLARTAVPVLFGAARRNRGVQPVLDAVVDLLPAPGDRRATTEEGPATVVVFKRMQIAGVGDTTWLRILGGRLDEGDTLVNARTGQRLLVDQLVRMHSNASETIPFALGGDIVAAIDLPASTGEILGEPLDDMAPPLQFPDPVMSQALELEHEAQLPGLEQALARLAMEDPTLRVATGEDGRIVVSGLGELHLEVVRDRLLERGLDVRLGRPQVQLRVTPTQRAEAEARVADGWAWVGVGPGRGVQVEAMDAADEPAAREALQVHHPGPALDLELQVRAGGPTEQRAEAVRRAVAQAVAAAAPRVLEPWMSMEIRVPRELVGGVLSEVGAHEGLVQAMDESEGVSVVRAQAPLRALFGYASELRSRTSGRADLSMEVWGYRPARGAPSEKR